MSTTIIEDEIKSTVEELVEEDTAIDIEDTTATTEDTTQDITTEDIKPDDNSTLMHHLIVKSVDGSISNMICPIEILFNAKEMQQPLIPIKYDPELFYAISAQKRFINNNTSNHKKRHHRHHRHHHKSEDNKRATDLPLKRRRLEKPNYVTENERSEESVDSDWRSDSYDIYDDDGNRTLLRHANRPRRSTRKNISYKEADPSVPQYRLIPVRKYPVSKLLLNQKKGWLLLLF